MKKWPHMKQDQHENKIWGPIYNVHAIHDLRHFVYIDFLYSGTNLFFFRGGGNDCKQLKRTVIY